MEHIYEYPASNSLEMYSKYNLALARKWLLLELGWLYSLLFSVLYFEQNLITL